MQHHRKNDFNADFVIEPRFKTLEDLRAENPVEDEEETLSEPDSLSIEAEEDKEKSEEKDEEIVHAPLVEKNVHSVH